jgi:Flp pilus assembly protein TadD
MSDDASGHGSDDASGHGDAPTSGAPAGEVYDWYTRALELLGRGDAAAAAQLLEHAHLSEPDAPSVREALARALFDAGRYAEAVAAFEALIVRRPDDDYAHFGLGLALARQGNFRLAVEHLALAAAMRPERRDYVQALRQSRATLRAREANG